MSKRKIDRVEQARRKLGCTLKKFFQQAAAWVYEQRGLWVGKGGILRALTKYKRRGSTIQWARGFIASLLAPTSFSELKA